MAVVGHECTSNSLSWHTVVYTWSQVYQHINCIGVGTLQKQVGCFNHRVVALVADKLERQWSLEVCFDVED